MMFGFIFVELPIDLWNLIRLYEISDFVNNTYIYIFQFFHKEIGSFFFYPVAQSIIDIPTKVGFKGEVSAE